MLSAIKTGTDAETYLTMARRLTEERTDSS